MAWYIVLAILILLIIFLLYQDIELFSKSQNKKFVFKVKYLGITLYDNTKIDQTKKVKKEKTKENKQEIVSKNKINFYIESFKQIFGIIKEIIKYSHKKIKCEKFVFDLTFGLKDAAEVGITTGVIWSVIGTVYPVLDTYLVLNDPVINVNPKFNQEVFNLNYEGIYHLKLIHIIYMFIKNRKLFLKMMNKEKSKGGV